MADTLNDGLGDPLYYTDVDRLRVIAAAVRRQHDISYVRIFDSEGRLLVSDSGERGSPSYEDDSPKYVTGYIDDEFGLSVLEDVQTRLKFSGNSLEVATPIQAGPQVLGAVQFAFADEAVGEEIDSIIQQHVWQGLILVAIGLVIAYAIARIATKPLQSLTAAARAIGGGNLDTPVVGSGARETRELGTALEGMRAELREVYSGLERQVALRTEDLLKTNEELADEVMQREHAEVALREAQVRLRTVVDNSRVTLFALDHQGIFTRAEGKGVESLSRSRGEVVGLSIFDVFSDVPSILETARRSLAGETRTLTLESNGLSFDVRYEPVLDQAGRVLGVVGVSQDITERKRIEERLRETSRLISVGELAAGVAHEINNPLTVVMGYAEILMERDVSEAVRTRLGRIHSEAGRAVKIVENLLFFARSHEPRREYQSIADILGRAVEFKARDLSVNNIALTTEWPDDLPGTVVDEQQLIQVLLNVVTNAEQAIIEAQPRGKILIRAGMAGNRIRISVTDDGPGIPPGYLHKVLDPFVTTKAVGKGTGLGLSICYGIVRQHGGDMWAESVYGSGASFHIELPLVGPERWPGRSVDEPSEELQQMPLSRKRILVVDDEPNIRSLVMEALSVEGLTTVDQAEDGQEAWHKLQEAPYDCILLDLKMPGMGGGSSIT